jgi:peroxiredoxin family protein
VKRYKPTQRSLRPQPNVSTPTSRTRSIGEGGPVGREEGVAPERVFSREAEIKGSGVTYLAGTTGDKWLGRQKGGETEGRSSVSETGRTDPKRKTLVVFSGDLDRALAALLIARGAAAMGSKVTMFFTFWGLNVLRRPKRTRAGRRLIKRMFGWMMPGGATQLELSNTNAAGVDASIIKNIMRKKQVHSLSELIESARRAGVRLVACSMSMELMGIRPEELVDGIEQGGVAVYLEDAEAGNVNLFI